VGSYVTKEIAIDAATALAKSMKPSIVTIFREDGVLQQELPFGDEPKQ
jgi:hypothetical protein